jgi:hypothetical protein
MIKQYGFRFPVITEKNWILGGFSKVKGAVINPSGQWKQYRPQFEAQSTPKTETQNCTGYGTEHAVATLEWFMKLQGVPIGTNDITYSPRAIGIAAGTQADGGNDPTKVADAVRNITCVMPESVLPFVDDVSTYYTPRPLTKDLLNQGQPWADKWELQYEIVFTGGTPQDKKDKLKLALQRGTVCVSVYAWDFDAVTQRYIKPQGAQDTHWVFLEQYDENDCPLVFDSYADNQGDPYEKTLDPLFDFGIAIVYYLVPAQPKFSLMAKLLDLIGQLLHMDELLIKNRPELQPPIVNPINIDPPPPAPIPPADVSKISIWAYGIRVAEGWTPTSRSFINHNPGNIKASDYTMSLGAVGKDNNNFCIFPDEPTGTKALCSFLTAAAKNELAPYHDKTIAEFTTIYAQPPSSVYLNTVLSYVKVAENTKISSLL